MAVVRWDPTRELDSLQGEMNRLFSSFFDTPTKTQGGNGNGAARRWIPSMDLVETQDDFVLKADLPGMSENDVNVELENNVLTISGERKTEHEEQQEGYYRLERATGSFSRALSLPEGIDADAVAADVRQRRADGTHPEARPGQAAQGEDRRRRRPAGHDRAGRGDRQSS